MKNSPEISMLPPMKKEFLEPYHNWFGESGPGVNMSTELPVAYEPTTPLV